MRAYKRIQLWFKKKHRFLTGSRVSQQKAASFCGNLCQNRAEEFRNNSANEERIDQKRLRDKSEEKLCVASQDGASFIPVRQQ